MKQLQRARSGWILAPRGLRHSEEKPVTLELDDPQAISWRKAIVLSRSRNLPNSPHDHDRVVATDAADRVNNQAVVHVGGKATGTLHVVHVARNRRVCHHDRAVLSQPGTADVVCELAGRNRRGDSITP